jgi:hypothetical protein
VSVANEGKTPEEKQQLWTHGLETLGKLNVDVSTLPQQFSPEYARFGASVPQQISALQKADKADEDKNWHHVQAGLKSQGLAQGAARVAQGEARVGFARDKNNRDNANFTNTATVGNFRYRFNPATGMVQRQRISQ